MSNKVIKLLPLLAVLALSGCSTSNSNKGKKGDINPFLIGDNLEAINLDEAKLIATEAYNNLAKISKLTKEITTTSDTTGFYVGGLSSLGKKVNKKETYQVDYYKNVLNRKYSLSNAVESPNMDKSIEERSNDMIEWYDLKKDSETEYSLYSKTTTSANNVSWDTYAITTDDFAVTETLNTNWNRHLIKNSAEFSDISIYYDANLKYVRDGMHILGYKQSTIYESGKSVIAPNKSDVSLMKKTDNISVVAFINRENVGWIVESVAVQTIVSYLNNLSGAVIEPLEIERNESVGSYVYTSEHEAHTVPTYKEDTSNENPVYISQFNDETYEYSSTVATFSNNDDYYRQIEAGYNGRAFYIERYLTEGIYSLYDKAHGTAAEPSYEVWGVEDIIDNRCESFITDALIEEHEKLFRVVKAGVYSFDLVFNKEMTEITTFTVAKMG